MPCYKPLNAYRDLRINRSKIVFLKSGSSIPTKAEYLRIPCGQCIGCKLDRSRMWATRCIHEARSHDHNSFITLTYDEKHLPPDLSLVKSHWQQFVKRLRRHFEYHYGITGIKYLHAGEYGEEHKRPHYHACLFGIDFPDKKPYKTYDDISLYTSNILDTIWGMGFTTTGDVTYESAAYVARYTVKKINGPKANIPDKKTGLLHYERTHLHTGEVVEVIPEYSTQSRNPGLGKKHLTKILPDIYPWDEVIINGHPTRPPRYYDDHYEKTHPEEMEKIRQRRIEVMHKYAPDNTRARLSEKEQVKLAQTSKLIREL